MTPAHEHCMYTETRHDPEFMNVQCSGYEAPQSSIMNVLTKRRRKSEVPNFCFWFWFKSEMNGFTKVRQITAEGDFFLGHKIHYVCGSKDVLKKH